MRLERVLRMAFEPLILTSTSAAGELLQALSSRGRAAEDGMAGGGVTGIKDLGLGLRLGLILLLFFLDSNERRTRCSSLMNSTAPPIMEAWSPFSPYQGGKKCQNLNSWKTDKSWFRVYKFLGIIPRRKTLILASLFTVTSGIKSQKLYSWKTP